MEDVTPWLIAGTGPSLTVPDDPFKVCTLNRAITAFERVDLAMIYHSLTLEAIADHLHKADRIVMPFPFDSISDWWDRPDRFYENPLEHPVIQSLPDEVMDRINIVPRQTVEAPNRDFLVASGCLPRGGCSVGALSILVREEGIDEVHTVGIDGGLSTAERLARSYSNRLWHPAGTYTTSWNQFIQACGRLGVQWVRIIEDRRLRYKVKWSGEVECDRSVGEMLEASDRVLAVG